MEEARAAPEEQLVLVQLLSDIPANQGYMRLAGDGGEASRLVRP